MDSPLKYDAGIVKEFGIKTVHELKNVEQLQYVRSQYDEIKKFLYRERVELILAETQAKSEVEVLAASARNKIAEHRNNIKGVVASLEALGKLVHELEAKVSD